MRVIPTMCTKCRQESVAVSQADQSMNPTWLMDNVVNHVCIQCRLALDLLDSPYLCLNHPVPINYREYCPACKIAEINAEFGSQIAKMLEEAKSI